jgi:hypothetical protein
VTRTTMSRTTMTAKPEESGARDATAPIIAMAHAYGRTVTAKGVETQADDRDRIRSLCDSRVVGAAMSVSKALDHQRRRAPS